MDDRCISGSSRREVLSTLCRPLALAATSSAFASEPAPPPVRATSASGGAGCSERWIPNGAGRLYARELKGSGPTYILLHGFPDNVHIYDELAPAAAGLHVAFDFSGFGRSDKPGGYSFRHHVGDLTTVASAVGTERIIPVAHNAGGPAAINFALAHPEWLLTFQNQRFQRSAPAALKQRANTILQPIMNANLASKPGARPASAAMIGDLRANVASNGRGLAELGRLGAPGHLVWGAGDPCLDKRRGRGSRQPVHQCPDRIPALRASGPDRHA